jgi:hypothetical protein
MTGVKSDFMGISSERRRELGPKCRGAELAVL